MRFIPSAERATEESLSLANQRWSPMSGGKRPLYTASDARGAGRSVQSRAYGRFFVAIFDEWAQRDVGVAFVRRFDTALANTRMVSGLLRQGHYADEVMTLPAEEGQR